MWRGGPVTGRPAAAIFEKENYMSTTTTMSNHEKGALGRELVISRLAELGAQSPYYSKQGRRHIIIASNTSRTKQITIIVKTKLSGDWQVSTDDGIPSDDNHNDNTFWVFVDISGSVTKPDYYVMPDQWIRNNIYEEHQAYLKRHGGERARNSLSKHHSITWERINKWVGRWNILNLSS